MLIVEQIKSSNSLIILLNKSYSNILNLDANLVVDIIIKKSNCCRIRLLDMLSCGFSMGGMIRPTLGHRSLKDPGD